MEPSWKAREKQVLHEWTREARTKTQNGKETNHVYKRGKRAGLSVFEGLPGEEGEEGGSRGGRK